MYTINTTTGAATPVGPVGYSITGLAWDQTTGTLYAGTSNNDASGLNGLLVINPATGAGTPVGTYGVGSTQTMADLAINSAGALFGFLEPGSDDLYSINKTTGAATLIGDSPGSGQTGLAFGPTGTLYLESGGTLRILDPNTGLLVSTVGSGLGGTGMGMDFSDSGILFAIQRLGGGPGGARNLVTVNTTTGAVTIIVVDLSLNVRCMLRCP